MKIETVKISLKNVHVRASRYTCYSRIPEGFVAVLYWNVSNNLDEFGRGLYIEVETLIPIKLPPLDVTLIKYSITTISNIRFNFTLCWNTYNETDWIHRLLIKT